MFVTCPTHMIDDWGRKKGGCVVLHTSRALDNKHRQCSFIRLNNEDNFSLGYLTGRTVLESELTCSTKQQLESLHSAKMPLH